MILIVYVRMLFLQYNLYDYQTIHRGIDKNFLSESIQLIVNYHAHYSNYYIHKYKYELDIILLDDAGQGEQLFPNLDHQYTEFFYASFQMDITKNNRKKGVILLNVEYIYEEAINMYYFIETLMLFFLAHEIQHYIQCEYLNIKRYYKLLSIERKNYDLQDEQQRNSFYINSSLENDANFFAYNFIKNCDFDSNHPSFNDSLLGDIEIFCQRYFPNAIPHDALNGNKAFERIKTTKKVDYGLKIIFSLMALYFLTNFF